MPQQNYGRRIAQASLSIEGIGLRPDNPFTWASDYRMPIYNDNRRLLASPEHRRLVTEGFRNLIEQKGIEFDVIVGTSTAGIAPAASVALDHDVPLVIFQGGESYVFNSSYLNQIVSGAKLGLNQSRNNSFDAIASTCPWAIPGGVALANRENLPFMYVREKKKGHGLEQQIEGIPKEGQDVFLLDQYNKIVGESYLMNALNALSTAGVNAREFRVDEVLEQNLVEKIELDNKRVLVIEDLVSTGGSSAKEVQTARDFGAEAEWCLSIFSYGLDEADKAFGGLNPLCNVRSILTYDALLEAAKDMEYLTDEQVMLLEEWRKDPTGWGEEHGFPRVVKGGKK